MQQPPRAYQYTSRMMPCAHTKVGLSQHRTTPRPVTQIRVVEETERLAISGGGCQREKRSKMYQQVVEPRRLLSQQAYKIKIGWDFNKLLLQQQAIAAGCCCSVLLYCGDDSAPPNKWGTVYAHNDTLSSIISRVETLTMSHNTCSNESSCLG